MHKTMRKLVVTFLIIVLVMNSVGIYPVKASINESLIHSYGQNTWAFNSLATGPNGETYLAHKVSSTEIAVKQWDGSSWHSLPSITASNAGDTGFSDSLDLVVDSSGKLHLAFKHYDGEGISSRRGVKYAVLDGASWVFTEVEAYSDPYGWKNFYDPAIAVDSNGKVHMVYKFTDSNDPRKYALKYATNYSGTWSISTLAMGTSGIDEIHDPEIGIDNDDNVHVSYVREDNQNNFYRNYYYTSKQASEPTFPEAEKLIDAVSDNKNYRYTSFIIDDSNHIYFTFSEVIEEEIDGTWEVESSSYLFSNASGNWEREQVYYDGFRETYPIGVSIVNSNIYMLMYSVAADWSEYHLFAMANFGNDWVVGSKKVTPALASDSALDEKTFLVDSNGDFTLVMLHGNLRNISSLTGTSEDFGLNVIPKSNNADLSKLTISAGMLDPTFDPEISNYLASVGSEVTSVTVTPTVSDSKATVTVYGHLVESGQVSDQIHLDVGNNIIPVIVTAEDGSTNTYTINITREAPMAHAPTVTGAATDEDTQTLSGLVITPNAQDTTVTHFKISEIIGGELYHNDGVTVINDNDYITASEGGAGLKFTPDADLNGVIGFSFKAQSAYDTLGTGLSASETAVITVTEVNDHPIAEDDVLPDIEENSNDVTITFANLLGNDKSGPVNESDQTLTISQVGDAIGGTVRIEGTGVIFTPQSNYTGAAGFTYTVVDNGTTNGVSDPKTAQGSAAFTVHPSSNAELSSLTISESQLSPAFSANETNYTATVSYDISSIDITPASVSSTAKIEVNGLQRNNGETITFPLQVGTNTVSIEVTANDQTTLKTYTIVITRAVPSLDADLNSLSLAGLTLTPDFNKDIQDYTVTAPHLMSSTTISAVSSDDNSQISIIRNNIETANPIELEIGENNFEVLVTAEDGTTTKLYKINIYRIDAAPHVTADDIANKLVGADQTMEFSTDNGINWTTYDTGNTPTFSGNVTVSIRVKASGSIPAGEVTTLIFTENPIVTPPNPPSSGGSKSSPRPSSNKNEEIVIEVDGEDGTNLTKIPIRRTTEPNGNVKDHVSMSEEIAKRIVEKAIQKGIDTASIFIPDKDDKVSETVVEIPKSALKQLNAGNIKLEISSANAVISIPTAAVSGFDEDLYFRVVPIKSKDKQSQIENRAKKEEMIQEIAKDLTVKVLGQPMEIETNLQNREVSIILPLKNSLPSNPMERQKILDNLTVFIEHSDGTKELIQGELVKMKDGTDGIEFSVTKFSTFTLLYIDGWKDSIENQESKKHSPYIKGYGNEFRPNAFITRAQMAAMLARNLTKYETPNNQALYTDVSDKHWAFSEIMKVQDAGIMMGTNTTTFSPEGFINRAQMATIAYRWIQHECAKDMAAFKSCSSLSSFNPVDYKDVSIDHWASEAIAFMKSSNFMVGYEDNTFKPNEKLTRAQAVKVLNRLFNRGPLTGVKTPTFIDVPTTHWAYEEIEEAAREHGFKIDTDGKETLEQ